MKRVALTSLIIISFAFAVSVFVGLKPSNAPRFTNVQIPASVRQINYDFLSPRPFEGGKMWITASSPGPTNWAAFVYDIEKRRVLGQVTNGWPEMCFGDPPRLLCSQPSSAVASWNRMKDRLLAFVTTISGGRIKFPPSATQGNTYWLLDLNRNTAVRLGDIPGIPNFSLFPSPDFHYCFTARHGRGPFPDFYLLDLQQGFVQKLNMPPWACDWWDNTHILLQTTNQELALYDIRKRAMTPLMPSTRVAAFLAENKIPMDARQQRSLAMVDAAKNPYTVSVPPSARPFAIWNGRENDFYLTDTHQKWLAEESFLIRLERPDGKLRLISPHFKFEWSDHLDSKGRKYLYSGRELGSASDGVFLRDLSSGTNQLLVAPGTNKYFTLPRFYQDSVIYVRSNALWRIGLDGANNTRLFPASESQDENIRGEFQHRLR